MKAVVQALEANAIAAEPLLDPLMAVETELDRVGQIRADLEECRPPLAVVDIEVVLIDGDRLPRKVKRDGLPRPAPLLRFERPHLLLRDAQDHDPRGP